MTTRKYSSRSQQTTLTAGINSTATSATVVSGSGLLGGITISAGETFTVVIDPDTALEEIVDVTAVSTNTLTIVRAIDTSPATGQAHSAGAVVRHMAIGRDYREANSHIENVTTAHGLTIANVLETTDTNIITSAMIVDGAIVNADINASAAIADTKLATISTASKVSNSATTATSANTASAIVARDASGNFTAGTITANVTGNVSGTSGSTTGNAATATALATGRTFQLTGDVEASGVTFDGTGNVSLTTVIGTGAIVNADVNASAQVAYSKLNLTNTIVDADINASAAITKTKISGTAITAADTGTVTSAMIADGTIVNADINASAAIDWTKLGISSTVDSTEISYVNGVTSAIQTQLDAKLATATASSTYAPLASPALTGVPTAPTAAANTNTTQIATTAYVQTEIADLIAAAPGALDTLDELAAALGDDAAFSTTVTNSIASKLPLAGGTMSGAIAMGTNKITGLGTPTTSTDASTKAYVDTMLPLAGGTMTGAIAMGTNKITGLGTPTVSTDAATKGYIDTAVIAPGNLTGPITSVGSATSVAAQTGTGSTFVMNTSPTLVTPVLGVATATSINSTVIPSSKTLVATDSTDYVVPSQGGNSGKYLTTNGTVSSWGAVDALPSQTGNSGKYLTTNGTAAAWASIVTDPTPSVFMLMGA
jgi:sulfur carrier protein ThiS